MTTEQTPSTKEDQEICPKRDKKEWNLEKIKREDDKEALGHLFEI